MKDVRRKVADSQERKAAKKFGAKQHRNSGSGAKRLDMHTDDDLIECKTVLEGNTQITIKRDDLRLLMYHAAIQDRNPVMHIRLAGMNWVLRLEDDDLEQPG